MMKIFLIAVISVVSIVALAQVFVTKSTNSTEQRKYVVLKKFDKFEIRKYEPALYSSVKLNSKRYKEGASEGFNILAGYIFGGNATNEKIAMTSPVVMDLGDTSEMMFMIPSEYKLENLPSPNNNKIVFQQQGEMIMAAIQFDGWADDQKIEKYKAILIEELAKENIAHQNKFDFLGYNPPFELINRRNEVVVEVTNFK